jgi:hypothetical protein
MLRPDPNTPTPLCTAVLVPEIAAPSSLSVSTRSGVVSVAVGPATAGGVMTPEGFDCAADDAEISITPMTKTTTTGWGIGHL